MSYPTPQLGSSATREQLEVGMTGIYKLQHVPNYFYNCFLEIHDFFNFLF